MVRDKRQYGWFELVDVKFRVPLVAILAFYLVILIVIAFFAGYFFYLYFAGTKNVHVQSEGNKTWEHYDLPNCSNMSLVNTSRCLNDFLLEVYQYKPTDDDINLSYDQLFNEGGDCNNWNFDYYGNLLESYGFNVEREELYIKDEAEDGVTYHIFHAFVIASDETGYCLLDLDSITCAVYVSDGGEDEE